MELLVASASSAFAESSSGGRGSFGLLTGVALPNSGDQAFLLGCKVEYRLVPFMKTAVFFETYGSSVNSFSDASNIGASTHTSVYGLEASLNVDPEVSVGAKLGLIHTATDVKATDGAANSVAFSSSATGLFVGPTIAYDQPIGRFALTVEAAYLLAFSSQTPKAVLISLGVKYLF